MLAVAIQFLYIGGRLRSDRSYAAFGLTLAFACLTFLPAVWFLSSTGTTSGHAAWLLFGRLAGLALLPLLVYFLSQT